MRLSDSRESVRLALDTLRKNKLRSSLTVLGISIGISTVILISSAINGLNNNVAAFIGSLGTNSVWIYRYNNFAGMPSTEELNRKQLTYEDAIAMRAIPHVVAVDPALFRQNLQTGGGSTTLKHGARQAQNAILQGNTTDVDKTSNLEFTEGRLWIESEQEHAANVVVLGHDAADTLFPDSSPIGQDIDCEGAILTVIGVVAPQPTAFSSGRNPQDNAAYLPLPTFRKLHPEVKDFWITVRYDDPRNKTAVIDDLRELLRRRRAVRADEDDNFTIFGPDALTRLWNQLTGGLFLFMVAVSSVGLLVGGVGVMNIMLVSVTERTREIGIRKAIGATRNNILLQFTLEAVTLCAVGGVIGILAGAFLTLILHFAVPFLHAALSPAWVAIAFAVSAAIGLIFGIYPAWKAASLDPIEALRYE